jgi:AraC-like DNA-binding protein
MHDMTTVNIAVLSVGFSQSLFAGIMMLIKKNARLPDRILAVWLFAISIQMLLSLLNTTYNLTAFPITPFIYGPLMYIYIRTLIDEKPQLRSYYISWLLPVIAFFILSIIYRNQPILIFDKYLDDDPFRGLRFAYAIMLMVSFIAYSILTFIKLEKHRQKIRELFSYTSQKITLGWALFVSISFFVLYFGLFALGFTRVFVTSLNFDPILIGNIVLIFYSFTFSIFGYQQERIYPDIIPVEKNKYKKSNLQVGASVKLEKDLITMMEDQKLYKNPELSILDVAQELHTPRHYITQVLNEKMKKNFYTFINEYRIEDVKERLKDPKNNNLTVLAIAYDAGFNSKSSFNTLFKQYTELTPSEFRKT